MTIDLRFYPFYAKLTPLQQRVYREFLSELPTAPDKIQLSEACTSDDVTAAYKAIYYDRPDYFWIQSGSRIGVVGGIATTLYPVYHSLTANLADHQKKFQRAIDSYLADCPQGTLLEKERHIHDKMVQEISYVSGPLDQSAYSALVERKSVCAGYSRGFQVLMQQCGIPCYYCAGTATGSDDDDWGPHAWNIVRLEDECYYVDVTFNDCYGAHSKVTSHEYFNCTEWDFAKNHKRRTGFHFLPLCTSTLYSFERVAGVSSALSIVYQDGVTCKETASNKRSFMQVVSNELRKQTADTFTISLPFEGKLTSKKAREWFIEAIETVYGTNVGYKLGTKVTDFRNGWLKVEFRVTRQ